MTCRLFTNGSSGANIGVFPAVTISSVSSTSMYLVYLLHASFHINCQLPSSQPGVGAVCVVRVTNPDGPYYDYSAVSIKHPSQTLSTFQTSPYSLIEGRRGAAVSAITVR